MRVTDEYLKRKYAAWEKFWDFDFPPLSDVDFVFVRSKDEWGSITWLPDGDIRISFDASCQRDSGIARSTLAHEMNHVANPKLGHGRRFNEAMYAALGKGLIYESLI